MKIKSVPVMAVMLLVSTTLLAQPRQLNYTEICKHIGNCLIKNYHPDPIALANCCVEGGVFIKFKVNPNGEITELSYSKGSPTFITDALTKAVDSLQHDISLIYTLKKSGRTIIQPFIYINIAGCKFPKITASSTADDRANFYPKYMQVSGEMDHILPFIINMLNFKDGKLLALDGILLSPIQVGSGGVE